MNNSEYMKDDFLNSKRNNLIKKKCNLPKYDQEIMISSNKSSFFHKFNERDDDNLNKFISKVSTSNSSEDIKSDSSDDSPYVNKPLTKKIFKYNNINYIEEDLFPNQEFVSFILGDKKEKNNPSPSIVLDSISNNNLSLNIIHTNVNTEFNESNPINSNNTSHTLKGNRIAKKLRNMMIRHIKSRKIIPEPEDLEYFNTNDIFIEWKYNENLNSEYEFLSLEKTKFLNSQCVICLRQFLPDHDIKLIRQCNHAFHKECIDEWLNYNRICPLDKIKIKIK